MGVWPIVIGDRADYTGTETGGRVDEVVVFMQSSSDHMCS